MKRLIVCCLLLLTVYLSYAQNLVPNPGFEEYDRCPGSLGTVYRFLSSPDTTTVLNWLNPTFADPDYYNTCGIGNVGIPQNLFGHHPAHAGNAYGGIVVCNASIYDGSYAYREYLQIKLNTPLEAKYPYTISCFVQLFIERNMSPMTGQYAVDKIHASFSSTQITQKNFNPIKSEVISMTKTGGGFMEDTTTWVKISGTYIAKGGEQWLTIGLFNDTLPPLKFIYRDQGNVVEAHNFSYYGIDEISVKADTLCDTIITLHDSAMCRQNALPASIYSSGPDSSGYLWNTGDTTRTITITKEGTYWCRVIKDCHMYVDSFFIRTKIDTVKDKPFRSIQFCEGGSYELGTIATGDSYRWNTGATTRSIVVTEAGAYICYIPINECLMFSEEYQAFVHPGPGRIKSFIKDTTVCEKTPLTIGRLYDFAILQYRWNTGDTVCCISPAKTGLYTVTISTRNCGSISNTAYVNIKDCETCIYLPDAFTPNGDGLNDVFRPIKTCKINKFILRIYNRWGQEVFYTADPGKGWNGLHSADIADVGTYFYLAEYNTTYDDKMKMLKGDVVLVR